MGIEIERKFLVKGDAWRAKGTATHFQQGYLSLDPARVVRVRIAGEKAHLNVKGPIAGLTRKEFEYEIPLQDARELLDLCHTPAISKTRYLVPHHSHLWEIDEFHGDNAGLIIAEVELSHEAERIEFPAWAGEEISNDPRYSNAQLCTHPYCGWKPEK